MADLNINQNTILYLRQAMNNVAPTVTVSGNRANFKTRQQRFSMSLTPRTTRGVS